MELVCGRRTWYRTTVLICHAAARYLPSRHALIICHVLQLKLGFESFVSHDHVQQASKTSSAPEYLLLACDIGKKYHAVKIRPRS